MDVLADWFIGILIIILVCCWVKVWGKKNGNEIVINFIITENGWGVCYMESCLFVRTRIQKGYAKVW